MQSAGADTIEFSFDVGVSDAMWVALEGERETAQLLMQERRCVHVPDWLNAQMHPTGARGGYRLAQDPREISLADLVTAVEGPIRLAQCVAGKHPGADSEPCRLLERCPVADPVHRVQRRLSDFLKTVTLAEIAAPAAAVADE